MMDAFFDCEICGYDTSWEGHHEKCPNGIMKDGLKPVMEKESIPAVDHLMEWRAEMAPIETFDHDFHQWGKEMGY